jgi:hypothetical protein
MSNKKVLLFTLEKDSKPIKFFLNRRMLVLVICFAALLVFSARFVRAQTPEFHQTGQIRPIVSETESPVPSWKNTVHDTGVKFSGVARSKIEYYFAYKTVENGAFSEKWVALSDDRAWNQFSNQTVRLSGSLKNNKLSNAKIAPLTELSEEYLTSPPPTAGFYRVVVVPLTIQPQSARGESFKNAASSNITPEAIRNVLFNQPDAVNKFYLEASYGKFGFTGVHQPQAEVMPVTIQAAISNNCYDQIISQFTPVVRERLRGQNIDTTNGSVDLGIIIFNDTPGCPPFPFATRGALGARGVPQWLWMPESWFVTGAAIMAHEIGHTLGGNHPVVIRCADFDNPQTCAVEDAADRHIMTSGGRFYMMPNNFDRRRWGWHPPGAFDTPSSGIVQMFDLHSAIVPSVKESLKRGTFFFRKMSGVHAGWEIYPEARRNWGLFEKYQAADEAFRLGIAVRYGHSNFGDPDAFSFIADPNNTNSLDDAPLRENQQISIGGVLIKCLREHNPGRGARMMVR